MKTTRRFLIAIVIWAVPTASTTSAPVPPPSKGASWEQILEWLPEDTETLIVAPQLFIFPKREPDAKGKTKLLAVSELLILLPVMRFYAESGLVDVELAGLKCLCMVEGSRCFTRPKDIGLMPYQGVHIIQFDPASDDAVRKAFQTCRKKADKEIELHSQPVAVFSKEQESDTWTYYLAQPLPGVLICATEESYLEETLKRMGSKPKKRAIPSDLLEWKHVDVKAQVWGIRHYREESADTDPTSPLNGQARGKKGNDNAAVGFVFWYNPDTSKVFQARYLSEAKNADEIVSKEWMKHEGLKLNIKKVASGVVEFSLELTKENESTFVLVLLLQLGHGILF
jgi:hypothetical protein